ncbi:MAG: hypothetical protein ACRC1K_22745 [Planctomycetia bacterium]
MILAIPPRLESALTEQARERGVTAEELVLNILQQHLIPVAPPIPADDWERGLLAAARDCGVSLPDSALSSDGLYD